MSQHREAAIRLHRFIRARHWHDGTLIGPDPGIRFNYRIWRFAKNVQPRRDWGDNLYYLQGQGYWVLANCHLFSVLGDSTYRDLAIAASDEMLRRQTPDGAWEYPNPEWSGRIATAEGTWGSIGLLATYEQTGDPRYLDGARRWYGFVERVIGFQSIDDQLAVNYFAVRPGARIPNNTAFFLRFLSQLADLTGDHSIAQRYDGLITFLSAAQTPAGELPYAVAGEQGEPARPHFQCFQYNAFQCLDLIEFWKRTGRDDVKPIIDGLLRFLRSGLSPEGWAYYDCGNQHRTVNYHTAVLGATFAKGAELGDPGDAERAARAFDYLLRQQLPDGGFPYSKRDYRIISDRRSYPRYQAMILYHLLTSEHAASAAAQREEGAPVLAP